MPNFLINGGWNQDPKIIDTAFDLAQKAINLDSSLSEPHRIMGDIYLYKKQHTKAIKEREKSVALDPNNADGLAGLGEVFIYCGQFEEGVQLIEKAIRLNKARLEIQKVMKKNSDLSLELIKEILPFKDQEKNVQVTEALRKAGLK